MPESSSFLLDCDNVGVDVAGRTLVAGLSLQLQAGQFIAILGKNGSGKTLTLKTLAGLRPQATGTIRLGKQDLQSSRRSDIARHLALLTQHDEDAFPATVLETVLVGRHPHIRPFQWESQEDFRLARQALKYVDLHGLEERTVATLSGGERRRLAIAQVLAQRPDIYLLDEPANHLDPQHELDILALFRRIADQGGAVITSLHDVNLAARFADQCLLLFGNGRWLLGPSDEVLSEANLSRLYETPIQAIEWRGHRFFFTTDGLTSAIDKAS